MDTKGGSARDEAVFLPTAGPPKRPSSTGQKRIRDIGPASAERAEPRVPIRSSFFGSEHVGISLLRYDMKAEGHARNRWFRAWPWLNVAKSLSRPGKLGPPQSQPLALWGKEGQRSERALTFEKVGASDT